MKNKLRIVALAFLCVFLAACTTSSDKKDSDTSAVASPDNVVVCASERPRVCTRDYRPVCAVATDMTHCDAVPCTATTKKTYSNGCSACADPVVVSYVPGECEE